MFFRCLIAAIVLLAAEILPQGIPGHAAMEEKLLATWNQMYPVPYKNIIKRDIAGKGILAYRTKEGKAYIYSYIVFMPHVVLRDEALEESGGGREITVRLYFIPGSERPYILKIGKFVEMSDTKDMIGWVKNK